MTEILLVLLLGAAIVGLIVAAVLQVRGLSRRRSTVAAVAAAAAGLAAVVLYGFELLAFALDESGPEYYDWSSYVEYHALPAVAAIALLMAYALLPVTLVAAAFAVGARRRAPGFALGAAGIVAAFLPLMVPSWLPDEARGEDAALYSTSRAAERRGPDIAACLPYGIDGGPDSQTRGATVCLYLADTPRARDLLDRDEGGIEMSRLADELNDAGIEPRDDVDHDDLEGLELERAEWTGQP
jgi:hypothetical protein